MSKVILNYTCENGHKWKSKEWPTSSFIGDTMKSIAEKMCGHELKTINTTRCPVCKSDILKCFSEDGKQGAINIGFKEKKNES